MRAGPEDRPTQKQENLLRITGVWKTRRSSTRPRNWCKNLSIGVVKRELRERESRSSRWPLDSQRCEGKQSKNPVEGVR